MLKPRHTSFFGLEAVTQPAFVIREEALLPVLDLTHLQKERRGPESMLLVCTACAESCFVPGRVRALVTAVQSVGVPAHEIVDEVAYKLSFGVGERALQVSIRGVVQCLVYAALGARRNA